MATLAEIESKISAIARKSSKFKIGETGQEIDDRLKGHGFTHIEKIVKSKNRELIDDIEHKMIVKFKHWKNNDNTNEGSAGKMSHKAEWYTLYVAYNPKSKTASK